MAYIRAGLGILLVGVAPGFLVVILARVRLSLIETLAVVPACSLGVVFLLAEVTSLVRIPFGPTAFFALLFALGVSAVVVWHTQGRPSFELEAPPADYDDAGSPLDEAERSAPWLTRRGVLSIGLLLLAVMAAGSSWFRGIDDSSTIPGNFDASQHGFMTARVARTESIAPSDVLVSDVNTGMKATNYYPLAVHASASLVHSLADVEISLTLTAITVFFAAFGLLLGLYALVRYIWPREPLAAGFAALLGAWFVTFPYKPADWGGIPLIVGMTLIPISIVFLTRALLTQRSFRGVALTVLVVAAGFSVHNSQLPIIVFLAGLLVTERAFRARSWRTVSDAAVRLVVVGGGLLVLLAPTLPAIVQGGSDRSEFTDRVVTNLESVLGPVLTLHFAVGSRQGWLALFALAGIVVLVWQRRLWSWVLGCAVIVSLTVLAGTTQEGAAWLTLPWYRQPERVAYNLAFFVPVFGGIALACVVGWVAARLPHTRLAIPGCAIGTLLFVTIATGLHAARATRAQVRVAFTAPTQPIGQDSLDAFRYLRNNAGRGLVVNDLNIDGSLWMYAFEGVRPLFALWPSDENQKDGDYRQRLYIRDHIQQAGSDPRLDRLIERYGVKFVYWGQTPFVNAEHQMDVESLRSSPGLEEVFTSSSASVFRVK